MMRWVLFVGLAISAAVAAGCGGKAAPHPAWALVSATCQEAMQTYPGFKLKVAVTQVDGDCQSFASRPVAGPQEWQQFQEETFYYAAGFERSFISTRRIARGPGPDEVYLRDTVAYDPWRAPTSLDLDPEGERIKSVKTLGMRYLPLDRRGCMSPTDADTTLNCVLAVPIAIRVQRSNEGPNPFGVTIGISSSDSIDQGIQGDLEQAERKVLAGWMANPDPHVSSAGFPWDGQRWMLVAELREFRTYLFRDVYTCQTYQKTGFGYTRFRLYCQLTGLEYQSLEAVDFYFIGAYTPAALQQDIERRFPGAVITPEAEALLHEVWQVSGEVERMNRPWPRETE